MNIKEKIKILFPKFYNIYFKYIQFKAHENKIKKFLDQVPENKLLFIHIPKCGGTTMKHAIEKINKQQNEKLIYSLKHELYSNHIKKKNHKFFFTIRHPYSVFCSAFYARNTHGQKRYMAHSPIEKKIYQYFKSPNELAENLNNKNNNHKQNLAKKAFQNIAGIRRRFDYWIKKPDLKKKSLFFIIEVEKFSNDFSKFLKKLNLPEIELKPKNQNSNKINYFLSNNAKKNLDIFLRKDFDIYNEVLKIKKKINES